MAADIRIAIERLKREQDAVILAHTYQPAEVQDIADFVGDSYGLSVEAKKTDAGKIIFCGVMFMAETAAILNPRKDVIIPEPSAGCPMADMINEEDLVAMKAKYPQHRVVCYVNSTAGVKALSDVCCTSSNALRIVQKFPADAGILFVPDKHLGSWVAEKSGRDMVLWEGFCPTHERITPEMIRRAREEHPHAVMLIHPEATKQCRGMADEVLSTGGMCAYANKSDAAEFVIATEVGILHTLRKQNPAKRFYCVDRSVTCPNMRRNSLAKVAAALDGAGGMRVQVADDVAENARRALEKMLEMSA